MSTRAAILRTNPDGPASGRYHHWDGYPTGLGRTLYRMYNGLETGSEPFKGNLERMLVVLLDEHTGWSTINEADWSLEPGYSEQLADGKIREHVCEVCGLPQFSYDSRPNPHGVNSENRHDYAPGPIERRPHCYCHGDRHEDDGIVTDETLSGLDYAYVFDVPHHSMAVCSVWNGRKTLAVVDLDGPEPNWEALDHHGD